MESSDLTATLASMSKTLRDDVFVGRGAEVSTLRRMVADVTVGQGAVVWVEGEPGVGKSSLLSMGLAEAVASGCQLYRGRADEVSQRVPLHAMLDCLGLPTNWPDPSHGEMIDEMLTEPRSDMGWPGDPAVAAAERVLVQVEERCAESPVVIIVDDLHWADDASLVLWHRLARLASQVPLLLVGATRMVSHRPELSKVRRQVLARGGVVLSLTGLNEPETTELLAGLLGAPPGTELRRFVDHTGGNPLYLRELTEALIRENTLRVSAEGAEMDSWPAAEAPRSLSSVIARRLDFLSSDVTDLLRTATLLGNEFAVVDLATILDQTPGELIAGVREAMAAGVIVEAGQRLAFRHPLIRRALYRATPASIRVALHRQAARTLAQAGAPAERVAEQLLRAPVDPDEWLIGWLTPAAAALAHRAPEVAVELLTQVVAALPEGDADREALAVHLAGLLFRTERDDAAEAWAREVLATTTDPERTARMRWCLGYILHRTGRIEPARAETRAALADPAVPPLWQARLQALLATILGCGFGDVDATDAAARQTLMLGEQVGDLFTISQAMSSFFFVHASRRDYETALSTLDHGLSLLGPDLDHRDLRVKLLDERIFVLHNLDRLDEAEDALRTARKLTEDAGEAPATRLHVSGAVHNFWLGRWDDALAELDAAMDNLPELTSFGLRARWPILLMHGIAALIAEHRDDLSGAALRLREGQSQPIISAGDLDNCDFLAGAAAITAQREGRGQEALALFKAYLDPGYGQTLLKHQWLPDMVRLALDLGDLDYARAATRALENEAALGFNDRANAAVNRCHGLLNNDPDRLLAVANHYRGVGRIFDLAQTLEDAAVAQARSGQSAAARASLTEAIARFTDLGATWDIRRAETRIREYGIRRSSRSPRRPTTGWEALSATELTVAYLVAEARSNPEIAAELYLSRRTVQTHVSHILLKLGAKSRVEIAKEALRHPREPADQVHGVTRPIPPDRPADPHILSGISRWAPIR
jgi:DNA-binding CsgD family transcriptional regulator